MRYVIIECSYKTVDTIDVKEAVSSLEKGFISCENSRMRTKRIHRSKPVVKFFIVLPWTEETGFLQAQKIHKIIKFICHILISHKNSPRKSRNSFAGGARNTKIIILKTDVCCNAIECSPKNVFSLANKFHRSAIKCSSLNPDWKQSKANIFIHLKDFSGTV